jgi:phosphate transport system protein
LKKRILKMSSLVDEQIENAIKVVNDGNIDLVESILQKEEKVDKYDLKIDKICQKIIALNQPVALDLRLIMSAITINTNLERIGDIAANIVRNYSLIKSRPAFIEKTNFNEMSVVVKEMIRNAIDSFINSDPKLAQKVIETDKQLDDFNKNNYGILINIMKENPDNIEAAVVMLIICRQLERAGDHATNIAEDVYFIVEAQLIKHNYEKYFFQDDEDEEEDKI